MTHTRMGDMAGNKKEHTHDIGTRCSRTRQWEVDFCRSHDTRKVARKRISPINCQSNLATQKIPLLHFYDLPPASSFVYSRLNFYSMPKEVRLGSSPRVALFQPLCHRIYRDSSFDNDGVKCKYYHVGSFRFAPLGKLEQYES